MAIKFIVKCMCYVKMANGDTPITQAVRLHSSFQSDNLLIEHYELFLYHHVFVVVFEKPVLESASLSNLIEKVCQGIPSE